MGIDTSRDNNATIQGQTSRTAALRTIHLTFLPSSPPFCTSLLFSVHLHDLQPPRLYIHLHSVTVNHLSAPSPCVLTFLYHLLVSSSLSFVFVVHRLQTLNDPPLLSGYPPSLRHSPRPVILSCPSLSFLFSPVEEADKKGM